MWVQTTTPLPTLVATKHPSTVRLRLQDGTHAEIKWPVMVGDSMVESDSSVVPPLALREVTTVQIREFSLIRTLVLAVTIPIAALWTLCAIEGCYMD